MDNPTDKYAAAGVDIDAANRIKDMIKRHARATHRPEVLRDVGFFGGLFELSGYKNPILVASTDGVGTKLKIASILGVHSTVGADLVNHCINDIFTTGASPLFFLDYIAMGKLVPQTVECIIDGIASACRAASCALIGGETAEMPGMYEPGEYDLVGFIVGAVEKSERLDARQIQAGDVILGIPSHGLHTNGYSLARKVLGEDRAVLNAYNAELGRSLGDELLQVHRCYYLDLKPALGLIKGMAHITGGGLPGNVPRSLPDGLAAAIDKGSWGIPPIFKLIQEKGSISEAEMYRVFNMGIGMAVFCSSADVSEIQRLAPDAVPIGAVVEQQGPERLLLR